MQSSYQFHFGGSNPIFGGGVDWGNSGGSGGAGGFSIGNLVQEVGVHERNASSVKEFAYTEDKNFRFRPSMEDTYFAKDRVNGDPNLGMFGVFDGHGGRQVADHCAERVPEELRKEIAKSSGDLSYGLEQVFLRIDNELRLIDADNTGSTACVVVVRQEMGNKVVYIANLGDTRAVLSKNGVAERMSYDHKASDPLEVERIRSGGGIVIDNRVGGSLAITRAFGDHSLKKDGVIAKPYIKKHILRSSDKYMVVASDGVWDVLEDQDAINYCKDEFNSKEIAQAIVKASIERGSKDNTSCLIIKFNSSPY